MNDNELTIRRYKLIIEAVEYKEVLSASITVLELIEMEGLPVEVLSGSTTYWIEEISNWRHTFRLAVTAYGPAADVNLDNMEDWLHRIVLNKFHGHGLRFERLAERSEEMKPWDGNRLKHVQEVFGATHARWLINHGMRSIMQVLDDAPEQLGRSKDPVPPGLPEAIEILQNTFQEQQLQLRLDTH